MNRSRTLGVIGGVTVAVTAGLGSVAIACSQPAGDGAAATRTVSASTISAALVQHDARIALSRAAFRASSWSLRAEVARAVAADRARAAHLRALIAAQRAAAASADPETSAATISDPETSDGHVCDHDGARFGGDRFGARDGGDHHWRR
jgi:hypothetical protein